MMQTTGSPLTAGISAATLVVLSRIMSFLSFVLMLVYPVLILFRIRGEEALLEENLPGYRDYKAKVRWRLIPFLW